VRGRGSEERGRELRGREMEGQGRKGMEWRLTLMRSWNRAADWLRPALN